jgi:soluble lytic murein transglycosylase
MQELDGVLSLRWCGAKKGIPSLVVGWAGMESRLLRELAGARAAPGLDSEEAVIGAASALARGGRHSEVIGLLTSSSAGEFQEDATFLRALALERLGRCGEAAEAYGAYAAGGGLLGDYALLFAARCLKSKGGAAAAVELLRRLIIRWKHSPLWDEAATELCTYYIDLERYADCIELGRRVSSEASSGSARRTAQYHMARAMVKLGRIQEASGAYWRIVEDHPSHPKAGQSYRAFVSVKKRLKEDLTPREMYLGAEALRNTGNLKEAYDVLKELVSSDDAGAYRERGLVEMASVSYRRRQYSQAAREYQEITKAGGMSREKARLWAGKALIRCGRSESAFEILESIGKGDGAADIRAEALWEAGREKESLGDFTDATRLYRFVVDSLPRTETSADAGWRWGFCSYVDGDFESALSAFDAADRAAAADYQKAQARYWKAKALLRLDRVDEAEEHLRLAASLGANVYYGARAAWVLRTELAEFELQSFVPRSSRGLPDQAASVDSEASGPASTRAVEVDPIVSDSASTPKIPCADLEMGYPGHGPPPKAPDPALDPAGWHHSRGIRLLTWGAEGWGALELGKAVEGGYAKAKAIEALYFYGAYNRAMKMGGDLPPRQVSTPGEDDMYMKYPLGFAEDVWRWGAECSVDPFLALALIRQESRFDPGAVSYAGARGLMQLMPATAKRLSRKAGIRWRGAKQALDPVTNVRLGTLELEGLFEQFGTLPVVLSAYNAGPGRAERWSAAAQGVDLDSYIEMIGFKQTRDYVKLVIRDYLIYLRLYDPAWGPQ